MSILREWVSQLGLREQGVLVVATRGCDAASKLPLDSVERRLTAAIRYAVLVPFDAREVDATPGCFMRSEAPADFKLGMVEHYPLHWVLHVVHAAEALGFRHPDPQARAVWHALYLAAVKAMHMNAETLEQYTTRLSEDRIAGNNVVSL